MIIYCHCVSRLSVLSAGDQSATDENGRIIIPPPGWVVVEKVEIWLWNGESYGLVGELGPVWPAHEEAGQEECEDHKQHIHGLLYYHHCYYYYYYGVSCDYESATSATTDYGHMVTEWSVSLNCKFILSIAPSIVRRD